VSSGSDGFPPSEKSHLKSTAAQCSRHSVSLMREPSSKSAYTLSASVVDGLRSGNDDGFVSCGKPAVRHDQDFTDGRALTVSRHLGVVAPSGLA